jgi:sister-chromatid-cohesion protein PDS5
MPLELLKAKIHDPKEKVQAAACNVYSQIDYEAALQHVSVDQLHAVAEGGMDKKVVYFPIIYHSY